MSEDADDRELVEAILRGQKQEFAVLLRRYEVKVRGYCFHMLREWPLAEDAAQEVFLKAYRSLPSFQEKSKFSSWLYRIASNHCVDCLRRRKLERLWRRESQANLVLAAEQAIPLEAQEFLQKILEQLSAKERSLILLREMEGLSYAELAETFNCTVESIKSRLKRLRKKLLVLKKELEASQEKPRNAVG